MNHTGTRSVHSRRHALRKRWFITSAFYGLVEGVSNAVGCDAMAKTTLPRVGISQCLLGDNVRYDGGHKLDSVLIETLGRHVEWVPVCPEVEVGLGTPREPMQLVGDRHAPRLVTINTGVDL